MTVFVDTSAFYAVLDRDDANHSRAKGAWVHLLRNGASLVTTNYVVVETSALTQHRLGIPGLGAFTEDIVPLVRIEWITEQSHRTATQMLLAAGRRRLSLVDCVSFETMRRLGVTAAFCFDSHFKEQGFQAAP